MWQVHASALWTLQASPSVWVPRPHAKVSKYKADAILTAFINEREGGKNKENIKALQGIDDPPNQTMYPEFAPASSMESKKQKLMNFLGGATDNAPDVFGVKPEALPSMVEGAHRIGKEADEAAALAKDAAEHAIEETAGVGHAVDIADEDWHGVLYAAKVARALDNAPLKLGNLEDRFADVNKDIEQLQTKVNDALEKVEAEADAGSKSGIDSTTEMAEAKKRIGKELWQMSEHLPKVDFEDFEGDFMKLHETLNEPNHPNLYPPGDGPGLKDGNVIIPLEFPPHPDPQIMEDATPPDVQAKMPPDAVPLNMKALRGGI